MGGHGGLNILPQKRWNVYNRDNRAKVERDKKLQQEKHEQQSKNINESLASGRYDILKRKKHEKARESKSEISNFHFFSLYLLHIL